MSASPTTEEKVDKPSGAGVRRGTNTLEDHGERGERLGVGVREVVLACLRSLVPEGLGEERDMGGFVRGDLREAAVDPTGSIVVSNVKHAADKARGHVPVREAGGGKGLGVVLGEGAAVEVVLEVLERSSILEHADV